MTTPAITKAFIEQTGISASRDAVKNRLARLREQNENEALVRYTPESEALFVPAAPTDEYVGLRLGFYDIETTDLGAFAGDMLCASVGDSWGRIQRANVYQFPRRSLTDDSGLAEWLRDELEKYDIIIGWNNFNFDQGFLQARLLKYGKRVLKDMMSIDPMWKARGGRYGARIGTSRLKNVAIYFNTPNQKTDVPPEVWKAAERGDMQAMDILQDRCDADVLVTRDVFNHLKPLVRTIHR